MVVKWLNIFEEGGFFPVRPINQCGIKYRNLWGGRITEI